MDEMVLAILKELELRQNYLSEDIETIYFGGGTPSLLNSGQIDQIIKQAKRYFETNKVAEITLEANPEDISLQKVEAWQTAGVNRVSLGLQTLDETILQTLNRAHSAKQAIESIELLQNSGLENLTIDLMYGLPGQEHEIWKENLQKIITLGIPHISAYAMTIEPQTVFGHKVQQGLMPSIPDERYEEDYLLMCTSLKAAGYEHYEVSNFARPGFRSQHNQLYWQGVPYLGLGPGAHSFNGRERLFNQSNNPGYIRAIKNNLLPNETEVLTKEQQYNEYLITRLRTSTGINLSEINSIFEVDLASSSKTYLDQCVDDNLAYLKDDYFILTEKGFFLSDAIILELMK